MKHLQDGYNGLALFLGLQVDRFLSILMISCAILLASYVIL